MYEKNKTQALCEIIAHYHAKLAQTDHTKQCKKLENKREGILLIAFHFTLVTINVKCLKAKISLSH